MDCISWQRGAELCRAERQQRGGFAGSGRSASSHGQPCSQQLLSCVPRASTSPGTGLTPRLPSLTRARGKELAWLKENKESWSSLGRQAQTGVNKHTRSLGFVLLSVTFAAVQDVPMSQKWLKAQAKEVGACHESRVPNLCLSGDSGGLGAIPAPGPSSPAHLQAPAEKGSPGTRPCPALPLLLRKEGKVQQSLEWGRGAEPPPSTYAYIKNEDIYRYRFWNTS